MVICPNCKLVNPSEALRCDCGYNFAAGAMRPDLLPQRHRPQRSTGHSMNLKEEQPRGISLRAFYFVCAVVCLLGIMPVAIITWQLLPPGIYPVILAGLPALPLLWISSVCFRRSGLRLEEFARREPTLFKVLLYTVFGALAVGFIAILDHLGLL